MTIGETIAAIIEGLAEIGNAIIKAVRELLPCIEKVVDDFKADTRKQVRRQWRYDQGMHQQRARNVMMQAQAVRGRQKPPTWQRARDKL